MSTTPTNSVDRDIPLDAIDDPRRPSRERLEMTALGRLADDMAAQGLLQAIGLVSSERGDRYEIVWGHRRAAAARLLSWVTIAARVYPYGTDIRQARMAENSFHEALTPVEEAAECARWREDGMPVVEIARRRRRSVEWVEGRLAMLGWPEDLRMAVAAGELTLAAARELVVVDFAPYRLDLLGEARRAGATARVVAAWVAAYHADRERIIANTITIEEIQQQRHNYIVRVVCELNGEEVPVEDSRTIRACRQCYMDLFAELKRASSQGLGAPNSP